MTRGSIGELVKTWRGRYLRASREQKTQILDELVALTGYHRKLAIRVLTQGHTSKSRDRRGRPEQRMERMGDLDEMCVIPTMNCSPKRTPIRV